MSRRSSKPTVRSWLALATLVLILDQITKAWVYARFRTGERVTVIPGLFDFTLVWNPGAAFSFLATADGWQRWFFITIGLAASAFILWLLIGHATQRLFAFALSLVLGGAIGNVIDRLVHGRVIDFLLAHWQDRWYFPAFNVADSAITVGAILLVLDELLRVRKSR